MTNDIIAYALVAAFLAVIAWWIHIQEKYKNALEGKNKKSSDKT